MCYPKTLIFTPISITRREIKKICPTKTGIQIFIAALFLIAKVQAIPMSPAGEWINIVWPIYKMDSYMAITWIELLVCAKMDKV